jgi:hypothetical protein
MKNRKSTISKDFQKEGIFFL